MSSPFSIFRKHQRAMMAAVGILCMVAFTLGGVASFDQMAFSDARNPLVATTSFGKFYQSDLDEMRYRRMLAKGFLLQAMVETVPQQMRRFYEPQIQMILETQLIGPTTERSVLESQVLAHHAQAEGIVVSDESITDFLRELTRDQVTAAQFQAILAQMRTPGRQRISKADVYDALRTELLAMRYQQMFTSSFQITPAQRWDYYQRLKRQIRAELVPIAAADFLPKVSDPDEKTLVSFFNKYKETEAVPGSAEPGFKIPERAAFSYVEAHYDKFYDPSKVTEAQIKEHYEKFKDSRYLYTDLPAHDMEEEAAPAATKSPATGENKGTAASEKPAAEKPAAPQVPAQKPAAEKPAEKSGPSLGGATNDEPANKTGSEKNDSSDAKEQEEEASSCAPTDDGDDKQDDAEAAKPSAEAAAAKPGDAAQKAAPASNAPASNAPALNAPATNNSEAADEKPATQKPADQAAATTEKPAESTPPATEKPKSPPAPPPRLSEKFVLPNDIGQGPKPKYDPLWKVEGEIRKEIAGQRAVEAMDKELLSIQSKLRKYSEGMLSWEVRSHNNPELQKPSAPNLAELVKSVPGVTAGHIPLLPRYAITESSGLGQSTVAGQRFVDFAMNVLKPFHLAQAQDTEGNRYVFWKSEQQEPRVPALAEVRSEVLHAWKMREARSLMLKQADSLAATARQSPGSLKQALEKQPAYKVSEVGPFSWMTMGTAGSIDHTAPPRQSQVPGVVDAGRGFMQKLFNLKVGEIGVAVNQPETIAYVARVTSSEPPEQVMRDLFLADNRDPAYLSIAREENGDVLRKWYADQNRAVHLKWERPPSEEQPQLE